MKKNYFHITHIVPAIDVFAWYFRCVLSASYMG